MARRGGPSVSDAPARWVGIIVLSNNTLERTVVHCGRAVLALNCVLGGPQWRRWSAAQLGR